MPFVNKDEERITYAFDINIDGIRYSEKMEEIWAERNNKEINESGAWVHKNSGKR